MCNIVFEFCARYYSLGSAMAIRKITNSNFIIYNGLCRAAPGFARVCYKVSTAKPAEQ